MKRLFLTFIIFSAFTFGLNAQNKIYINDIVKDIKNNKNNDFIIEKFPISDIDLKDIKFHKLQSIIDYNTVIFIDNKFKINTPSLDRYIGKSKDNDKVFITLIDDKMYCFTNTINDEKYNITPIDDYSINHTIYKQEIISCNSIEPVSLNDIENFNKGERLLSNDLLQVNIALDACKEWYLYKFKGDTLKIRDYILSAYSMVSLIYENDMNIKIHIPWMNISTNTDGYNSGGTSTNWGGEPWLVLSNMPTYWKNNNLNVSSDLVHAVSVGGRGGIGNYDALASKIHDGNTYGPFAAISINGDTQFPLSGNPYFNFDFDVHTIAHELGHNFNCPHTHSCLFSPPIDTCVIFENNNDGCQASGNKRICTQYTETSIMSYCREINNWRSDMTFLDRPSKVIRTYAEKYLKEYVSVNENNVDLFEDINVYPNPTFNNVIVDYKLDNNSNVKIYIIDILGQNVMSLIDKYHLNGTYKINTSLDILPIGIYELIIKTNNYTKILPLYKN